MLVPTGKGWGFRLWSNTALIKDWMDRWCQIDGEALREKAKTKRLAETSLPTRTERESRCSLHEGSSPSRPCACSIPSRCKVPLQGEAAVPSLQEELAKLGPVERAWVINHELTPAQLEELGIKLPETPRIPKKCTCGTEIPCTAHD